MYFYGNGLELTTGFEVLDYHSKEQKNRYLLEMEIYNNARSDAELLLKDSMLTVWQNIHAVRKKSRHVLQAFLNSQLRIYN